MRRPSSRERYLYVVWVDPNHDVTPVYPWNAAKGWGSRPANEAPTTSVADLDAGGRYAAPKPQPGVATIVLLARPTPLDVPDDEVNGWFESLPELSLPPGGDRSALWFDRLCAGDGRRKASGDVPGGQIGRPVRGVAGPVAEGDWRSGGV